jgi:hypothetical protein
MLSAGGKGDVMRAVVNYLLEDRTVSWAGVTFTIYLVALAIVAAAKRNIDLVLAGIFGPIALLIVGLVLMGVFEMCFPPRDLRGRR